jgi:bifunctional UDP-N-acetylglucosamine pyrophosphorylase/glucosamine-1-phosphate N-acetyltransferase
MFDNPTGYGRIVRENGFVTSIVEEKEATLEQKQIKEINTGLYAVDNQLLFKALDKIDNNNSKNEYYLTDIVKVLSKSNRVDALVVPYDYHLTGINDLVTLDYVERKLKGEN